MLGDHYSIIKKAARVMHCKVLFIKTVLFDKSAIFHGTRCTRDTFMGILLPDT